MGNELELPCCVWFYPVAGYMPFHPEAYTKAKEDLAKALNTLNSYLLDKTYVVGEAITLADITIASALVYPFKLVCDKAYLKPFGNVTRWFNTCVNQAPFKAVIGSVTMCKKEVLAKGAEQEKKKGGGKKEQKKKEKKAEAPPPAPAPKKQEHPYKIMDKEKPSPSLWMHGRKCTLMLKRMMSPCLTFGRNLIKKVGLYGLKFITIMKITKWYL